MGLRVCLVCTKTVPANQAKCCGKCRQAIYCSKECQVKQWKTHKRYCVAYADIVPPLRDPTNPVEVYNRTVDIMFDEAFSKWFMRWWRPLSRMTLAGVDLGKYPERAETHCMVIWAVPNFNLRGSTDSFQLGRGEVMTIQEVTEEFPTDLLWRETSTGAASNPSTIVLRCDPSGEPLSARWHCESAESFDICANLYKSLPSVMTTAIALTWFDWLKYLVNNRRPEELVNGQITDEKFNKMFADVKAIREKEIGHTFSNEEPRDLALHNSKLYYRKLLS